MRNEWRSDKWIAAHLGSDIGHVDAGHEFAQETVQFRTFDVAIAWNKKFQKLIISAPLRPFVELNVTSWILKVKYGRT
jgi:hypothetical protein